MEFTEEKAIEIIEQFKLSTSTLKVWKTRGKIPDTYLKGEAWGKKEKVKGESKTQQSYNLLRALKTEKINITSVCRLAELKNDFAVKDFIRGKTELNAADLDALKKAINTIRNEMKNFISLSERKPIPEAALKILKRTILRPEVVTAVLLERKKEIQSRFYDWAIEKRSFPIEHLNFLRGCFLIFVTETTI